ncbi:MAG: hypothetical protein IRY99_11340, partial [Isosphaeraceae bacterium]|nr:hypothetical protein [Isosphaeraceae bacterium]
MMASRVPLLDHAEARCRLPLRGPDAVEPLPAWARALAASLPRTTAALLELDYRHRALSPLDPILRGKLRRTAALANRCAYGQAYAEADLHRAGMNESTWDEPSHGPERHALDFARPLTLAADTITDEDIARLIATYGERQVVAIVQLLAYANFQDRLLLTLGLPVEPDGPLPPRDVRFDRDGPAPAPSPRCPPEGRTPPPVPERVDDPEWTALDFDDLKERLERQRLRLGRLRIPSWDEIKDQLPPGYPAPPQPLRIQWSLICLGYSPE